MVLYVVATVPGLEGRVDARAARQSIRALHPREVIVLGGTRDEIVMTIPDKSINYNLVSDEVRLLAEAAQSFVKGGKVVWTPSDGETVELDVGHSAFSVRLVDTPYRTAAMIAADRANNIEPEAIEPFETKLGLCNVSSVDFVATGQKVALDGSLVLAPRTPSLLDNEDDVPSIYISDGEILLTNLRAELIALGMKAEYSAHTGYSQLLINGKILVRKEQNLDGPGRMQIEGPLCEDFYSVRAILYGQYIVL
jgi:Cleavage and polyadenylation factor 2 C-terminal